MHIIRVIHEQRLLKASSTKRKVSIDFLTALSLGLRSIFFYICQEEKLVCGLRLPRDTSGVLLPCL